jgi:hypothetical protein
LAGGLLFFPLISFVGSPVGIALHFRTGSVDDGHRCFWRYAVRSAMDMHRTVMAGSIGRLEVDYGGWNRLQVPLDRLENDNLPLDGVTLDLQSGAVLENERGRR